MSSTEVLEAELAVKTSLVEALNAENEQLRLLLQKHADQVDSDHVSRLAKGDMRRESNINELQAVIAHMRTQLYENASDHDLQTATLGMLKEETAKLKAEKLDLADENAALKQRLTMMQAQLAEEQAKYDAEREKVLMLRAGLEESKKAIAILKESSDRRNSEVASRRASDHHNTLARQNSLVAVNVNVARRGSLNYLTGLGLTSKRLNHFDPNKKLLLGSAKTESDLASLAASIPLPPSEGGSPNIAASRRASLPASPQNYESRMHGTLGLALSGNATGEGPTFGALSRRSSLHAGRRSSLGLDTPTRRKVSLNNAMVRLTGAGLDDGDLPLGRRQSTTIDENEVSQSFTALPEIGVRRRASGSLGGERRRSSVQGSQLRRGSDRMPLSGLAEYAFPAPGDDVSGLPATVAEEALSPTISISSVSLPMEMRTATYPPHEPDGVVQALSLEAAMEISSLKELIADLKMQLFESEESREASETCARALREFIATSASAEPENVKLPPLPTDAEASAEAEVMDSKRKLASVEQQESTSKDSKRASRWGMAMPKLLPTLSYSAIRRDASNSIAGHLPPIVPTKSDAGSQLQVPAAARTRSASSTSSPGMTSNSPIMPSWRANGDLRHLSVSSGMSGGSSSAAPSPILSSGLPNFQSSFNGFSFAAVQYRQPSTIEEPPSPGGGRDSPTFSSLGAPPSDTESASESGSSMPPTPSDATFGDRADPQVGKERAEEEARLALDPTMTPRPVQAF